MVPGPVTRQGAVESDHDEPEDDQPWSGRTEDVDDEYTPVPGRRGPVIGAHVIAGRRAIRIIKQTTYSIVHRQLILRCQREIVIARDFHPASLECHLTTARRNPLSRCGPTNVLARIQTPTYLAILVAGWVQAKVCDAPPPVQDLIGLGEIKRRRRASQCVAILRGKNWRLIRSCLLQSVQNCWTCTRHLHLDRHRAIIPGR